MDTQNGLSSTTILARFSRLKIGSLAFVVLAMATIPNLPGFGHGLTYTAFFFTPFGAPLRWAATAILAAGGLILLFNFVEAIFTSGVAVWLKDEQLHWQALGHKTIPLSSISSITVKPHVISLQRNDGKKKIELSTVILKSSDAPEPLGKRLRELTDQQP